METRRLIRVVRDAQCMCVSLVHIAVSSQKKGEGDVWFFSFAKKPFVPLLFPFTLDCC